MEPPSATAASLELIRSEDDEECLLLRGQLGEDDGNNDDTSLSHSSESEDREGHILVKSCPLVAHCTYTVTCTVSIALALPTGNDDDTVTTTVEKGKKTTKTILAAGLLEAPKLRSYYHIEYSLLPDNSKPVKVDLVMLGLAAKVYMENETKVLKPWLDGDQVWVGWSQSVKLNVTRDLLIKMNLHKITFRVWDSKDRVSTRAKYDRPVAFRPPLDRRSTEALDETGAVLDGEAERFGDIKSLVYKLRAAYEKENPKSRTSVKFQRELDYKQSSEPNRATVDTSTAEAYKKAPSSAALNDGVSKGQETEKPKNFEQRGEQDEPTDSKKMNEAILDQDKDLALLKLAHKRSFDHCAKGQRDTTIIPLTVSGSGKDKSLVLCKKKTAHKSTLENTAETEQMSTKCVASVKLNAMYLLAGDRSLTGCFQTRSGTLREGFCSIALDQPLMSEQLKAELNPLVITILSASSLPSTPVPFNELQQKCLPVYCQYEFPNMPVHRAKGQHHGSDIYFRDINVILTGLLSAEELLESLRGPMIEIEVHDRDRKAEKPLISPAIFGTELDDDKLASAVTKRTTHSCELRDPYGIAKLNLSDLLRGCNRLNLSLPIRCSHRGQWMGTKKNDWERNPTRKGDVLDESQEASMPMGHYIEANSKLRVQVEIAKPLVPDPDQGEGHCPFGRIVYVFNYNNVPVLTKLRSEILRVNVAAFHLDSHTEEIAQKVLCDYRVTAKERANNVLTGFNLLDKSLHLFILEGLKEHAIKELWETVPGKLDDDVKKQVTVLYNSSLSFSKRLYESLDVGLSPVHLHQPLDTILKEPLVYIGNMVPYTCLQALLRINHLCQVKKLEEVVHYDLFPSAKMVLSLEQEFGILPRRGVKSLMVDTKDSQDHSHHHILQGRTHTPLDNFNKDYLEWKRSQAEQGSYTKNFLQANTEDVHKASSVLQKPKPKVFVAKVDDGQSAHNYSTQKMNSTALAHVLLRKEMAKVPARRFSYNQQYHSFTVEPVDVEAELKASKIKSRAAWQTYNGFVYPGFKSSIESSRHPKRPDEARVEELRKPWRENILHRNTLSPVLKRSRWPWSHRHEDFNLYTKPPAVFSLETSRSNHLAGESWWQQHLKAAHTQYSTWHKKLLPDKDSEDSGRITGFKYHIRRESLDKPQDLLKDKRMNLERTLMALKTMPVFPVAQQTYIHTQPSTACPTLDATGDLTPFSTNKLPTPYRRREKTVHLSETSS